MSGWDDFVKELNSGTGQQASKPPAAPSATQQSSGGWDDFMNRINGESAPEAPPIVTPEQPAAQEEPKAEKKYNAGWLDDLLYPGEKAKSRRDARRQAEAETNAKGDTYADALIQAGAVQPKKTGIGWIDNLMRTDTPIEETDQRVRARHAAKNLVEAEDAQAAMDKERETAKASGLGSEDWYAQSKKDVDALNEQYRQVNRQLQAERAKAQEGIFAGEFSYMFEDQRAAAEAKAKELEAQSKALEKQIEAANARLNYAGAMRWDDAMESEGFEAAAETGKADSRNKVRRAEKELSNEFYNPEKSEVDPDELRAAEFMSDSEKQIYDWLLASRGEEAADQYLAELSDTLNMRQGRQIAGEIEDMGSGGRAVNTVALAGATGVGNALKGLTQNMRSDAAPTSATDYAGQYARQDLEDAGPKIFDRSLAGLGYDAINTIGNMAPSLAVGAFNPVAGAVTMGLSSKGNAYKRALDEGYSKGQAQVYSSVIGAAEGGLQYLLGGLSKLGGIGQFTEAFTKNIGNAGLRAAAELGIDLFGENLEETLQNKLDLYMRNTVFGENNEIKLWDEDDTYTVMLTTLTTLLMNAGQTHNTVQVGKVGRAFYQSRDVDVLLDLAAKSGNADVRTMADDIISGKTKATDNSIGELAISYAQAGGDLSAIAANHATVDEAATEAARESAQNAAESPASEGDIPAPAKAETAPTVESAPPTVETAAEETAAVEAPPTEAAQTSPEQTAMQPTAAAEISPVEQSANGKTVERGFSENVRTDENMEQELRDDFTNDPDYYTQLSNKDTLAKAQEIFNRGLDEARKAVDSALGLAKNRNQKLSPEIVPLARMVANELTRNGEKASARRILSDLAVELTQAGQLGQAAKILRATDAQTALKTVQKALDKINNEIQKKRGNKAKWKAELTEAEIEMLNNIDMGDEAAFQEAYKQIAKRIGAEMPATLWEKITEFRRVNMLLKPRTQIRNVMANVPMVAMRKGAETISGAIQDAMVKTGLMDKAEQTRTLKVSKETRNGAKEYFKANKDSILSEGNKWDINTALREYRTYFKDGALSKALSKLTGKEQHNLMEQARRFTYDLLEKGDAPFVKSAFVDSLAEYMAAKGLTDFSNVPQEALDFAMSNALEATFKNANVIASFINQVKRSGGAAGKALDIVFPFTTTPLNITSLMMKYSPVGFGSAIYDAFVKKANAPDIIDKASKATVGSAMFGLGVLLRSLGAITGKQDDDKDKAALDKATGKSAYSIGGRWSYDWAQPFGSLLALGAETWDAIQGQEKVSDAVMNALYSAGDSVLNMSLFQNVTSMLKGYGSNTENIMNAIVEGGGTQLVPGLAGDIAAMIDDTVRSSYTGGNVFQNTLAKMGMNIPGVSKTLPASVNVKGEENKRGNFALRFFERMVDPGTINKNEMTDTDRAIYDLYEDTNDKTIFPHVAPTKFDYDGETYQMTGEERAQFQTTQGQIYYEMLDAMLDSGEWDDMSRAAKVKMLQDAAAYASDEAKRELVEARGGEYESSQYEKISNYADGDLELASQILSVRNEAKDAIGKGKPDILDQLLGKGGAYNDLSDEAKELLNVDHLEKIVAMHDNGMDAAGALTVIDTIGALEPEGDHKSVTQQQKVDAIIGTDLTDKEKIAAIKTYTSDSYVEKMQAAVDAGVSLEKWSEVRNKYAEISDTEGLTAMQKATQFAAALDKDKSLTEKQRQILREQLTYSSMSTAEAKRYDELTDTGMSIDTATKVTDLLASVKPLDGKTSVTQDQKVDAIINGGLNDADTWAALKVYTSDSWYNRAEEAYRRGIDLDDYVRQFREADLPNDKGETNGQLSQDELWQYYKANPANETFVKVMWLIGGFKTDWATYKRKHK